ncbi:MAG: SGNH/GDSL hydrolase family protein, partial [Gemmatimonadaceae bacterium]
MGTRVLGPLLLPVIYVQARRVRRTLLVLPEPPGARAGRGYPAAGAPPGATPGAPPLRLLVVGDSAAAGVGAPSQDEALLGQLVGALAADGPLAWRLVARTGATAAGTRRHLAALAPEPFDVAVTSLGLNDVTAGRAPAAVLADLQAVIALLRERFGVRHVVLSGLPRVGEFPSLPEPLRGYLGRRARALDGALAAWAGAQPDVEHLALDVAIDPAAMASDGFHPGPAMYAAWAR